MQEQRKSLSAQLIRRVAILAGISILGLSMMIYISLVGSLDNTENQLQEAGQEAATAFEQFLTAMESDLQATGASLSTTQNPDFVFQQALSRQPSIFEMVIVDPQGNILAQRRRIGGRTNMDLSEQPWLETIQDGGFYLGPVDFEEYGVPFANIAVAVPDKNGELQASLVANVDLTALWNIAVSQRVGQSGYTYVTNADGQVLAYRELRLLGGESTTQVLTGYTPEQLIEGGFDRHTGISGQSVLSTGLQLDAAPWYVIVEQPLREALRPFVINSILLTSLLVFVGFLVYNTIRFSRRQIASPLAEIQKSVGLIGSGDLDHRVVYQSQDELGLLADTFNNMAAQLKESIGTLEQRVVDRTRALETSTEVSRRLSTILDQDRLVREVVEQLQVAFGYYHAHIYLYGDDKQNLNMVGGTGDAGRTMLARGHSIERGQGLVGRAAETGDPVLVPDTAQAEGWLPNPLLPETKAEVAVPITIGDDVLGVLDVQHNVSGELTEADADLIQAIASQVAVALQNAQAYERAQSQARREAQVGEISQSIQSAVTIDEVLKIAVSKLGQTLEAKRANVELSMHKDQT